MTRLGTRVDHADPLSVCRRRGGSNDAEAVIGEFIMRLCRQLCKSDRRNHREMAIDALTDCRRMHRMLVDETAVVRRCLEEVFLCGHLLRPGRAVTRHTSLTILERVPVLVHLI